LAVPACGVGVAAGLAVVPVGAGVAAGFWVGVGVGVGVGFGVCAINGAMGATRNATIVNAVTLVLTRKCLCMSVPLPDRSAV
jgi:hypothetical protein